mmetsp:Transcript_3554/g.11908  ORF Transcript_3554/g.11908 Transcript_3554/m.11908 type:complete len:348 (-) Transcript_3554:78-1121(-)
MGGLLTRDGPRTICLWARVHARWRVAGQRGLGERAISWVRYASARHLCPSHPLRHGASARAPTRQRRRLEETCRTGTSNARSSAPGGCSGQRLRDRHRVDNHDLALPMEPGGHSLSVRDVTARRGRRGGDGDGGGGRDRAGDGHTRAGGSGDRCGVAGGGGETADALGAARTAGRHQRVHVHGAEGACALGLARRSPEPHKSDGAAVGAGGGGAADSVDLLVDALVVPAAADRDCEHRKETADHAEHHQPDGGGELKVECADDAEGRVEDKKTDQEADEHEDVPPAFRRVRADELPHLAAEGGPVAVPHAEPSGSGPVAPLPASAGPAPCAVMLDGKAHPALGQRRP